MSEKIFLDKSYTNGTVFISDARIILSGKTYSTANVTSVGSSFRKEQFLGIHPVMAALGIAIMVFLFSPGQYAIRLAFFLSLIVYGVCTKLNKTYHIVRLGSASGENEALQSENQTLIVEIVEAINQAIVHRSIPKEKV